MALGRKTGGRRPGTPNKRRAEVIAAAAATGKLPEQIMLARAREWRARELELRAAANDPDIDPQLQSKLLAEADRICQEGHLYCRDAAPYFAPKLFQDLG